MAYPSEQDISTRLSALRYAESIGASRHVTRQGMLVQGENTAEELVKDAKIIEAYLTAEVEL